MELREIAFIADDLYNRTVEAKRNGKWTKNDLKTEAEMYKELKKLGFDFYWHMQLAPTQFTAKDTGIIPIFTKYYGKFDSAGLNEIVMYSMGVPGLYGATQFYLDEYRKHTASCKYEKFDAIYNTIGNALYRIKDPHKVKEYMEIINDNEHLDNETVPFVIELLGRLKVKEAMPRLLELLEYKIKVPKLMGAEMIKVAVMRALGCYKDSRYISELKRFFDYSNLSVQEAAAKAVKKMGGQVEKVKEHGKIVGWQLVK